MIAFQIVIWQILKDRHIPEVYLLPIGIRSIFKKDQIALVLF
jgi:hypothetical protein